MQKNKVLSIIFSVTLLSSGQLFCAQSPYSDVISDYMTRVYNASPAWVKRISDSFTPRQKMLGALSLTVLAGIAAYRKYYAQPALPVVKPFELDGYAFQPPNLGIYLFYEQANNDNARAILNGFCDFKFPDGQEESYKQACEQYLFPVLDVAAQSSELIAWNWNKYVKNNLFYMGYGLDERSIKLVDKTGAEIPNTARNRARCLVQLKCLIEDLHPANEIKTKILDLLNATLGNLQYISTEAVLDNPGMPLEDLAYQIKSGTWYQGQYPLEVIIFKFDELQNKYTLRMPDMEKFDSQDNLNNVISILNGFYNFKFDEAKKDDYVKACQQYVCPVFEKFAQNFTLREWHNYVANIFVPTQALVVGITTDGQKEYVGSGHPSTESWCILQLKCLIEETCSDNPALQSLKTTLRDCADITAAQVVEDREAMQTWLSQSGNSGYIRMRELSVQQEADYRGLKWQENINAYKLHNLELKRPDSENLLAENNEHNFATLAREYVENKPNLVTKVTEAERLTRTERLIRAENAFKGFLCEVIQNNKQQLQGADNKWPRVIEAAVEIDAQHKKGVVLTPVYCAEALQYFIKAKCSDSDILRPLQQISASQ